jgi:hypothetical protein
MSFDAYGVALPDCGIEISEPVNGILPDIELEG